MAAQSRADLRSAYLYLVCLVTLVLSIFAAVNIVRDLTRLAYPNPGYYGYEVPAKQGDGEVTEQDIERQEELSRESQRRDAVQGLVGNGTMLAVAVPIYLYHWRRVQAETAAAKPEREPAA